MPEPTSPLRLLSEPDVLAGLRALRTRQPVKFTAFFSSQLGGVVTDPALTALVRHHQSVYEDLVDPLATLREPVDTFFDQVMVMADDEAVRRWGIESDNAQ